MPREPNSPVVTLKGAADCVEGAKKRIKEIADDLESMVTIECEIAQKHHRSVMGPRGRNVQEVTSRNNVQIKFPDRAVPNGNVEEPAENGDVSPRPSSDIILIKGKQEDAEQAKRELLVIVTNDHILHCYCLFEMCYSFYLSQVMLNLELSVFSQNLAVSCSYDA